MPLLVQTARRAPLIRSRTLSAIAPLSFAGLAMLGFGVIVIVRFARSLRGEGGSYTTCLVIGVAYVLYGAWALAIAACKLNKKLTLQMADELARSIGLVDYDVFGTPLLLTRYHKMLRKLLAFQL